VSAAVAEAAPRRWRRLSPLAARIFRMEVRHSAFFWALPLLAVLFIYDPLRTASGYPDLWPLRATVVLNKFWPDCVPFAAGFSAWAGSREGRRHVGDLLATTARPAWTRQLGSLAGTLAWANGAFLIGAAVIYVTAATAVTWGGPPVWPVVVGVVALTAVCAFAFTLGALFPGRFTAPLVAVGITVVVLEAFRQAVSGSAVVAVLSPDGSVPPNDSGLFYPVAPDVSIVQVMFFAGASSAAIGLLGLSPRTGGVGWRGALAAASAGGARLRTVATAVFAAGVALAVVGSVLAGTATGSVITGGTTIPLLHDSASDRPLSYTPVCAGGASFRVCVHPAYQAYLSRAVTSFDLVMSELAGLPGAPVRAVEVPDRVLPAVVLDQGGNGVVAGTPPVYEFVMDNAVALVPDPAMFQDGFEQDIAHAVIVGPVGRIVTASDGSTAFQPDTGTQAQQAVLNGLLKAIGSQPYPDNGPGSGSGAPAAPITAAAARFAALPAGTRHAWLVANLAALKAGHLTLAQVP
jgi:hypothetical protein